MTAKDPLLELVKRRHPMYEEKLAHWDFLEATYEGGRSWFVDNIWRYMKEGDLEYEQRVERAYRFNHTKQVVDLVDKYLFKMKIERKTDDAPESIKTWWKDATRNGQTADEFFKQVSTAGSKLGRPYVVVDSTAKAGEAVTKADEKKGAVRVYTYIVRPQDMLDFSVDELGEWNWVLIKENTRDDADPLASSGKFLDRYRLWSREEWVLYEKRKVGRSDKVVEIDRGPNTIGRVPVVRADHNVCDDPWTAPSLIDDIAYLDRANANYLSNLDAIIQDQTFSQLTMPAQGMVAGEDGHGKLVEMSTKRVFTYNGESPHKPEYISPDPTQAGLILNTIAKIVGEIYHSVGLTAERTGSNDGGASGGDEASGVAKAYDFEKVNSLLAAKAAALELVERKVARLVAAYSGEEDQIPEDLVIYPIDFDVRGIYDEFEIGARLMLLAAPDEMRREQMRLVIKKLFPAASEALQEKLEASLKDWPPEPIEAEPGLGAGGKKTSAGAPVKAAATQSTAKKMAA